MQTTANIMMVRPVSFGFNNETESDNLFQRTAAINPSEVQLQATKEFDAMVEKLRLKGVRVSVFDPPGFCESPDAVFPNNWVSFHSDKVILYPMMALNRRTERNYDALSELTADHKIIELSNHGETCFLEGTGSLVLDRKFKVAYAALSSRTHRTSVTEFCSMLSYQPMVFHAFHNGDPTQGAIYHTNVLMSVGSSLCICCLDAIPDSAEKHELRLKMLSTGKELLEIDIAQMNAFAGNMIEIKNEPGQAMMVMSSTAQRSLSKDQLAIISAHCEIIPVEIPTIEMIGGGSARCMIAEVF